MVGKTKHKGTIISCITINGLKNYNPIKIANKFGKFYSNLGANLTSSITPGPHTIDESLNNIKRNDASLVLKPITVLEIEHIIRQLPNKTSHRHDKISNKLLKDLSCSISLPLCSIFNQSITEGKFSDAMKKAEVIPLYKRKEFDRVINYRPISLLLTISKVLVKSIYTRVYNFLEKYHILYNSQYGFRNKRSCQQAILELVRKILQAKNRGDHSASLFLDLSKAFDTLDHEILLKKFDLYGLRALCNDWFRDYLTGRSLVAKLTTTENKVVKSDTYHITYDTAQGSCLGPLLFLLFCNDVHLLPTYSRIILFTDDTTLLFSHKNIKFLKYALEYNMSLLMSWYKANKLSLNINKTVLIKYWPDGKCFDVEIEGVQIKMKTIQSSLESMWMNV